MQFVHIKHQLQDKTAMIYFLATNQTHVKNACIAVKKTPLWAKKGMNNLKISPKSSQTLLE
jgi:hypothetical protein